ncbi:MAG: type IV pilus modification PilV family protein [Candidatus Polarisedimenticolia bacterium]
MSPHRRESGFTLAEVVTALFVVGVGILAVAPLFYQGSRITASSDDMSATSAAAVERLELLRATPFTSLAAGGSLTTDTTGFFNNSDPDVLVRWTVTNDVSPPKVKTIVVRAIATRTSIGLTKECQLATKRTR